MNKYLLKYIKYKDKYLKLKNEYVYNLTNYFINSSHNTSIISHQLFGIVSISGIAIHMNHNKGGCLEIDIIDIFENDAIISHKYVGGIFMNIILLRDLLKFIKIWFETNDIKGPLILSIDYKGKYDCLSKIFSEELFDEKYNTKKWYYKLKNNIFDINNLDNKILLHWKRHHLDEAQLDYSKFIDKNINKVYNISFKKIKKFDTYAIKNIMENSLNNFIRVYPSSIYFSSKNYDLTKCWQIGCQMVSINLQTQDRYFLINEEFFKNGPYRLKPIWLLNKKIKYPNLISLKLSYDLQNKNINLEVYGPEDYQKEVNPINSVYVLNNINLTCPIIFFKCYENNKVILENTINTLPIKLYAYNRKKYADEKILQYESYRKPKYNNHIYKLNEKNLYKMLNLKYDNIIDEISINIHYELL
jgi:hypothetical protein